MAIVRTYNYKMGFKVNNVAIPDPSGFTGKVSDLDTEGGRDATGTLHRHRVATKFPLKLQYNAISYEMMESIMSKMSGASFNFTYPDPLKGLQTIKAYVGDRDWEMLMMKTPVSTSASNTNWKKQWFGNLSFSVIQY